MTHASTRVDLESETTVSVTGKKAINLRRDGLWSRSTSEEGVRTVVKVKANNGLSVCVVRLEEAVGSGRRICRV
jgi:hypothetical protein